MAGEPVVHIGENSPEHVAYTLLKDVMSIEMKTAHRPGNQDYTQATKEWLLTTYAECLQAVRNPVGYLQDGPAKRRGSGAG
jgi:hypothetical protein